VTVDDAASADRPLVVVDPGPVTSDPQRVVALLESYRPHDDQQSEVRRSMLAFLRQHPDALERTCEPGHFTASALVVADDTERFVLLHHTKLQRWLQPGGHVDGSSNMPAAAWREATEETGIDGLSVVVPAVDLDIHTVDHGDALGEHLHLDLRFVVVAPPDAAAPGNHESLELRWVDPDGLAELADEPGLLRLARLGLQAASGA